MSVSGVSDVLIRVVESPMISKYVVMDCVNDSGQIICQMVGVIALPYRPAVNWQPCLHLRQLLGMIGIGCQNSPGSCATKHASLRIGPQIRWKQTSHRCLAEVLLEG